MGAAIVTQHRNVSKIHPYNRQSHRRPPYDRAQTGRTASIRVVRVGSGYHSAVLWTNDVIDTDRLTLRPPASHDSDVVFRFLTDPDVRRYLGGHMSVKDARNALAKTSLGERWGSFLIVNRDTDEVIGSVTFDRACGELEVSYALLPERWGNGYAAEALRVAMAWAWQDTGAVRLLAVTQTANEASVQLLTAVGMTKVSEFEEYGEMQAKFSLGRP